MRQLIFLGLFVFSVSVSAGDRLPSMVEVAQLEAGALCGEQAMGLRWIESPQQYQKLTGATSVDEHLFSGRQDQRLLLVSMGQQRSAGFYLELLSPQAQLQDDRLHLMLAWHKPKPGQMTAQMITRPCLLLALPMSAYQGVQVYDQQQRLQFELELERQP